MGSQKPTVRQAARLPALPAFPGSVEVGMAWMITEAARRLMAHDDLD